MSNYSSFYLSMLFGLSFMVGFLSASEFGFMSFNFFLAIFFWIFGLLLMALCIYEKCKASYVDDGVKDV